MTPEELGSMTAKNGFRNEQEVANCFNEWKTNKLAQEWLKILGYKIEEIESVKAEVLSGYKTDVTVMVSIQLKKAIDVQNLQVKLVSNKKGFNQIDKRKVSKYTEMWNIPDFEKYILERYTGEKAPNISNPRDKRRMFADEFNQEEQDSIIKWLNNNRINIVTDIMKGRGRFAAEWMLVIMKLGDCSKWILKPMNYCMNFFGGGNIYITSRGNFKIGRITMQRKGGDGGRDSAKMLQFKIDPTELLEEKESCNLFN